MTQLDNDFIQDLERPRGGRWVKSRDFSEKGQKIGGILHGITVEDRTDDKGNPVKVRGTDRVRKVYRVTFEVPADQRITVDDGGNPVDDNGVRIWEANEAGQTAIRDGYKAAGTKELIGGQFSARILAAKPDEYSQATYQVKFDPPAPSTAVDLPDDDPDW